MKNAKLWRPSLAARLRYSRSEVRELFAANFGKDKVVRVTIDRSSARDRIVKNGLSGENRMCACSQLIASSAMSSFN